MSGFPKYVSVADKRAAAARKLKRLKKQLPDIQPVLIEGSKIATTWWGISWNKNLEGYADFSNRISRGRSYVKNGSIAHLEIGNGIVEALVFGSNSSPYQVRINIEKISKQNWEHITELCGHSIDSLDELSLGQFPKDLKTLFMSQGDGLFPTPDEIQMQCSCPDWATMCKHVAAVMYGIGTRLDHNPILFFKLRNAPYEELIRQSIENRLGTMLENANQKSDRTIKDTDIESLFEL